MTTTEMSKKLAPIHPGEVLMEDFIKGFGITQNKLAVAIGVPPRRINEIVHCKRGDCGYGAAAWQVLRGIRAVLTEPADPIRP